MPVQPNLIERLLLFRFNKAPAALLDLISTAGFEGVVLARDLGVFEALADGPTAATDLAIRLEADVDGLGRLLDLLVALGYLDRDGGRYSNTAMTSQWLLPSSATDLGPWFEFWRDIVLPFWKDQLETAVRTGAPSVTLYDWLDESPRRWERAQAGFRSVASLTVDEVNRALTVPDGPARLIDVGGGHGLFAIELCRAHPQLSATVFDRPPALDLARAEVAEAGLDDRIEVVGGDYLTDDLGEGFDLALVFNVIHAHGAGANVELLERVAGALAPGGRLAVLDQLDGTATMPVSRAGLSFVALTYLTTLGAEIHPYDELTDWLRTAGFEHPERSSLRGAPGVSLVQATTVDQ